MDLEDDQFHHQFSSIHSSNLFIKHSVVLYDGEREELNFTYN